jgi:hypothetical protein
MNFAELVETRIQEAIEAGAFEGLEGVGRPLANDASEQLAGDNWMGFKILRNANLLPPWLELAREIEAAEARLAAIDRRHAEWVSLAAASGDWKRLGPAIARLRTQYEEAARSLRKQQDRFNVDSPGISLERPGVWVEHELERLDARVAVAIEAGSERV